MKGEDRDGAVDDRTRFIEEMAKAGHKGALEQVSKERVPRYAAAGGLAKLGDKKAFELLIETLNDESPFVRAYVAWMLGRIGPAAKAAIPALTKALDDEEHRVRGNVSEALMQIKGERKQVVPNKKTTGGYPDWMNIESDTYKYEDGSAVIYAVGVASAGRNPRMMWDAAKTNALVNLSRVLNTHVRAMFTSYAREAGDFYDEDTLSSIRNDEQVVRTLSESFLSGAIAINKDLTGDRKEAYILMKLNLDNEMLQKMSDRAKASVREHFAAKVKAQTDEALANMDKASADLKRELAGLPPIPETIMKADKVR
jgi:hypothetical protein